MFTNFRGFEICLKFVQDKMKFLTSTTYYLLCWNVVVINGRQGYRLRAWHGLESTGQGFMVIDVFLAMDNEENYEG
jgi:hypothetical protein